MLHDDYCLPKLHSPGDVPHNDTERVLRDLDALLRPLASVFLDDPALVYKLRYAERLVPPANYPDCFTYGSWTWKEN